MFFSIKYKLFLAILLANFLLVTAMYVVSIRNFENGFIEYLNQSEAEKLQSLSAALSQEYAENQSLSHLKRQRRIWHEMIKTHVMSKNNNSQGHQPPEPFEEPFDRRGGDSEFEDHHPPKDQTRFRPDRPPSGKNRDTLSFDPRLLLLDEKQQMIIGNRDIKAEAVLRPIVLNDKTIGYLGVVRRTELSGDLEKLFIQKQQKSFAVLLVVLFLLSVVVAFPLASSLVRPIRKLVAATHNLISGEFSTRTEVKQNDELGLLAKDFNVLAKTLEENQKARQQWIADISHELRTPLAVLKGEIEAIQDGVRPMNKEAIVSLAQEVDQLNALVNDLYEITLSDLGGLSYKKSPVILIDVINAVLHAFKNELEDKNIKITTNLNYAGEVIADKNRLIQLLNNLMQNTLRYTDSGGELHVFLMVEKDRLQIRWSDSSPGVSEEDLPRLFDRLYRAGDKSRNREIAGAGLGMAICKNIVYAHDGEISAKHSCMGGIEINITLPI